MKRKLKNHHENTKYLKHEIIFGFVFSHFRAFVINSAFE